MTKTPIPIGVLQGDPDNPEGQIGIQQALDMLKSTVQQLEGQVQKSICDQGTFLQQVGNVHEQITCTRHNADAALDRLTEAIQHAETEVGKS